MPRERCENCDRPKAVCLCAHLVDVQAPCQVVILQHPSEQKQALATVPILQLCLNPLDVYVGEDFSNTQLANACLQNPERVRVVFPGPQSEQWRSDGLVEGSQNINVLIVIDGTWRKAKRIWHMNTWLHDLPCVSLCGATSEYRIRSSSVDDSLSTLEAVAYACQCIDPKGDFNRLRKPFKAMIDMQIERMGESVFLSHYAKDDY